MAEEDVIKKPVEQDKVNKAIYDAIWNIKHHFSSHKWLEDRLERDLEAIKSAMECKTYCAHCGQEKE